MTEPTMRQRLADAEERLEEAEEQIAKHKRQIKGMRTDIQILADAIRDMQHPDMPRIYID